MEKSRMFISAMEASVVLPKAGMRCPPCPWPLGEHYGALAVGDGRGGVRIGGGVHRAVGEGEPVGVRGAEASFFTVALHTPLLSLAMSMV